MRSILAGLRTLVLPWGAPSGTPRLVFGPDIPTILTTYYSGSPFFGGVFACELAFSTSDTSYEYVCYAWDGIFVWRNEGSVSTGTVRHRVSCVNTDILIGYGLGEVTNLRVTGNGPGSVTFQGAGALLDVQATAAANLNGTIQRTDSTGTEDLMDWNTGFTTTWTAGGGATTLGNGTLTFRYKRTGQSVEWFVTLVWGSTTSAPAGTWEFTLPFNPFNSNQSGHGFAFDTSAGLVYPLASRIRATTSPYLFQTGGPTGALVTNASPMAWGNGDVYSMGGVYRANV